MTKLLARIPFQGFYNTIHDAAGDDALRHMFSDHATGCHVDEELYDKAFGLVNWRGFHNSYARGYCDAFSDEFELGLEFESLESPREYNFETDKIFVHIALDVVKRIFDETDAKGFAEYVLERCSHRSGFISHYPADLNEWPELSEWDHNHLYHLLNYYLLSEQGDDWELYAMESYSCNGYYDAWLTQANDELITLVNTHYNTQTSIA